MATPEELLNAHMDPALETFALGLIEGQRRSTSVVPTGFAKLDRELCGGLRRGQLAVIAGETGVGTSTFAVNVATHTSVRCGAPAVFVAPDSSRYEILTRVTAAVAKIPVSRIRSDELTEDDREKLRRKLDDLRRAPLHISAGWPDAVTPSRVAAEIESWCRNGAELAVVDGTALTEPHSRDLVRGLKVLAQRESMAVIFATKTSTPKERAGQPPRISDLSAHADLADLADLVLLLHRNDMHDHLSLRPGEADLEVAKHRYGPTRNLVLAFQGHYARFVDLNPTNAGR